MTTTLPATYPATRRALHAVAEHVLAAALHRATGRIGLRATPGGFGTPPFTVGGVERQIRVEGIDLVARHGTGERRAPLRTIGAAAAFVGTEPGAPESVYRATTPLEPDARLAIDADAATIVHSWFRLTASALEVLRQRHAALEPSIAQLWPEHFDLAVTMGEVTYGASPGDEDHGVPYAYVGPWDRAELVDDFWNEPFGAGRSHDELRSVDDVLALFESGHDLISQRSR